MIEISSGINRCNSESVERRAAVYLDHHATTPIDPRVAEAVFEAMTESFGNAHSIDHVYGQSAASLVESAAEIVGGLVGADPTHVRFTSGATEAIRIAIAMIAAEKTCLRVAVSRVEHKAVLDPLRALERQERAELHWIEVDSLGRIALNDLKQVAEEGIDLVCLMAANNEVGTIYPIRSAAMIAAEAGSKILVDATPAVGRLEIDAEAWGIDYLVMSAHKLYGPKGAGALIAADANTPLFDEIYGHLGTLNVPAIAGFAEACRIVADEGEADLARETILRNRLEETILRLVPDVVVNGDRQNRLGNNLHISAAGAPNDAVLSRLHRRVAISTGAACSSGAQTSSHVLRAMKMPTRLQESALRVSTGKFNSEEEVDFSAKEIAKAINDVRDAMRMT